MYKRLDSKENRRMVDQISSILSDVLKEESDDENFNIKDKLNYYSDDDTIKRERSSNPGALKERTDDYEKIFLPKSSECISASMNCSYESANEKGGQRQESKSKLSLDKRHYSPNLSYKLKKKKSSTPSNKHKSGRRLDCTFFPKNLDKFRNVLKVNTPSENYNSTSTVESISIAIPPANALADKVKKDCLTEFDEILENEVRPCEKVDEFTYNKLKGKFMRILRTQNGSRVLQKSLSKTSKDLIEQIFVEICPEIDQLMTDPYANYFCHKIFAFISAESRMKFLTKTKNRIVEISKSKVGTYLLQAILEQLLSDEEKIIIIKSVDDKLMEICDDPQGVHVVEKMIICFEENLIENIYEFVPQNFLKLVKNANGLCICKKVISHSKNENIQILIRDKITQNCIDLVEDAYANYAIQMALEIWSFKFCLPIIECFISRFYELSLQKYSSNVIEKCLEKNDLTFIAKFVDEICYLSKVVDLMKNSYGNYVVQKALKVASGLVKRQLVDCITKNLEKLNDNKLIKKWKRIVNTNNHLGLGHSSQVECWSPSLQASSVSLSTNLQTPSPNSYHNFPRSLNHSPVGSESSLTYKSLFLNSPVMANYRQIIKPRSHFQTKNTFSQVFKAYDANN